MKAEMISQELWQRHELEWQAVRARPEAERYEFVRRDRDHDEKNDRRPAREH